MLEFEGIGEQGWEDEKRKDYDERRSSEKVTASWWGLQCQQISKLEHL